MFDTLTGRLDGVFRKLRSRGKLHPKQVDMALAEMRVALLEADVSAEVADALLDRVRARALSEEVMKSLTPAQQVIKVVRDELQSTMGGTQVASGRGGTAVHPRPRDRRGRGLRRQGRGQGGEGRRQARRSRGLRRRDRRH